MAALAHAVVHDTRYKPGDKLPNGAEIGDVADGPKGPLLLCRWRDIWVTWLLDPSGHTVAGRYFETIGEAVRNFRLRLAGRA